MNNVMLGLIGIWEIGIILLILLVMAGLAVGVVLLVVWLVRRNQTPPSMPANPPTPRPTPPPPTSANCPRCGAAMPPESPQGLCPRCVLGVGLDTQTEATGEFGPHGTKIVPPPEAEVARRFPHLEILGCLGHGGMGVVYKARQPKLNRLVALKILAPEKGADPKFAERFLREAQALARLSHPNIVTVHDFGEVDGMFFLLMEYVDGMTLRQLLREGRMKPEAALVIVPPICEALQFAHEQGVVHRDIKPENVLLDKQGRVKIADFGIAKIINPLSRPADTLSPSDGERAEERGEGLTQDHILGTPHYMAPEQVEKPSTVDHRADIYSLGVVFYEMLTGELPLGKFQPPSKKVHVDVRLDEVVLHALEKEPDRRYQHASQVKTDVENIAGTPTPSAPTLDPLATARWRRHLQVKYACLFFAALCFLIATISFALEDNALAGLLSGVAVVFLSQAGYRHWCAAQKLTASATGTGANAATGAIPLSSSSGRESAPSEAARPPAVGDAKRNAKEAAIVLAGTIFLMFLLAVGVERFRADPLPYTGFLILIPIVGLVICALCLAGRWPVSSPWFPEPNFSSRNLNRWKATAASPPRGSGEWKIVVAIVAAIAGVGLLVLALPVGYWLLARQQQVSAQAVVRVEDKLRREILQRMGEGGWKPESLSVSVAPNMQRAECRFGRIWKNGLTEEPPPRAAIHLEPQANGLWMVRGEGLFESLRFSVDTSAEMASHQGPSGAQPGIFQYAEPDDANSASSLVQRAPSFGPVRELTLNHWVDASPGSEALDLDRGELVELPKDFEKLPEPEQMQWLRDQGADLLLLLDRAKGQWGLITVARNELKLAWLPVEKWDTAKHEDLSDALEAESVGLEIRQRGEFRVYLLAANQHPPLTFAFHTARGARGLLQITSFTEQPDSARMRFKLLQWSGGGVAGATPKIVAPEFGPMIERIIEPLESDMTNSFLALDTGKLLTPPPTIREHLAGKQAYEFLRGDRGGQVADWIRQTDATLLLYGRSGGIETLGGIYAQAHGPDYQRWNDWDALTPADALDALETIERGKNPADQSRLHGLGLTGVLTSDQSASWFFKTRDGTSGILQIAGTNVHPRGVKIRYKQVQAALANGLAFGPVIERELPDPDNGSGRGNRETLRLRSGERVSVLDDAPKESGGRLRALAASEGDLFAEYDDFVSGRWALVTAGLKLGDFLSPKWETATPGDVDEALRQPSALQRMEHSGATLYYLPDGLLPMTFAFESRTGERGLLQISSFSDNPRGVKIRYKLVQAAGPNALTFGPVIERVVNDVETGTNYLMDFDTGIVSTLPPSLQADDVTGTQSWYRKQGVDVNGRTKNWPSLCGRDLAFQLVREDRWNNPNVTELQGFLERNRQGDRFPQGSALGGSVESDTPTFLFKTREGSVGLLQITGFTDSPRGVKIRYKLVQPSP